MDQFFLFPIDEESANGGGRSPKDADKPATSAVKQDENSGEEDVLSSSPGKVKHTSSRRTMKPPPSSPTSPTQSSALEALPQRGRRWSLDVISPLRLLVAPHSTSHANRRPVTPESGGDGTSPTLVANATSGPGGRRYSQPIIPKIKGVKDKSSKVKDGGGKKDGKSGHWTKENFVLVHLDTGQTVVLTCHDEDRHLKQLLSVAMMDRRVLSYRMIVASSRSVLKGSHSGSAAEVNGRRVRSCEDLLEVLSDTEDAWERDDTRDARPDIITFCRRREILREMARTERHYYDNLQAVFEGYAEPLRKFSSLTAEEHRILFMSLEPILSLTASLVNKLETALNAWDSHNSRLGNLFSNTFWNYYKDFYKGYSDTKSLLLGKQRTDPTFEEFCELRRRQGRLSLEALLALPVKRIPDYARYLNDLLEDTDPSHPDYEDLSKAAEKVTSMVKEREHALSESDHHSAMDAVQDRFPKDDLHLHQSHPDNNGTTATASNTSITITSTNNNNSGSISSITSNSNGTGNSVSGSPVPGSALSTSPNVAGEVMDSPASSMHGNGFGSSPLSTSVATPTVELRKDSKSHSSNNSSGNSSPSGVHRKNSSKHNSSSNSNNNNNNKEDKEAISGKVKVLSNRRRSAPSAVLFKSLAGSRSRSSGSLWSNAGMGKKDHDVISSFKVADTADSNRMFITEGPVQLATGMQIQERYLFLFTDLLLVAKQKSSTAFKLKQRVELCDMWIASCIEEVSETTRPPERSFVLGWPTTNVVATFPTDQIKADWLHKLAERITEEKLRDEGKTLQLKVAPRDIESSSGQTCQMTINNVTQAKDVLHTCLRQMNISESESSNYQLWVISGKEGSPYPLIGHETPFSIKLSQVRELTSSRSRDDVANLTSGDLDTVVEESAAAGQKCEFYVKHKKTPKKHHLDDSSYQKSMKKSKKSPNIISNLLRKIRTPHPLVFGLALSDICDENFDPPESIIRLMVLVYRRGPTVSGILRRGNKASLAKEIREKIDAGVRYTIEDHQAPTAASVFKEFLRCIPGGLLVNDLHDQWLTVSKDDPAQVKLDKIKGIMSQLPPAHYRLLKLTVSLLQHLAKHSEHTNMGPGNLATCIAPSFCSPSSGTNPLAGFPHGKNFGSSNGGGSASSASALLQVQNSMREITTVFTPLIAFMIVKHIELFSPDILAMFVKYDCEPSPPIKIEESGEEGGGGGEEGDGDGGKMESMTDSAGGSRHRDDIEEEDDDDDEMMEEEEDDDDDDEEEEEDYEENYGHHQAQLRRHPHSHHADQLQTQRQRTQATSGPRDSNSGTDSDSMHSVLSMPDTGSGMGYRRDDSSLDSLVEREYFQHEEAGSGSPQAHKSHLSPSNLSRDSGLTLSDTQLYEEDPGTGIAGCPYPGETATAAGGRFYQRSTSSNYEMDHHHPEEGDDWLTRSMVDSRAMDRRGEPGHPPRLGREGKKKSRDSSEGSDGESGHGPATSFRSRPPFKHSTSSPLIDIHPRGSGKPGGAELKACLTHPPIGKRISSDSIGEEDEGQFDEEAYYPRHHQYQHHQTGQPASAIDFRQIRHNMDMGTIVKSDSGTHLFLSDDTLPTRYNLTRNQGKSLNSYQAQPQHGRVFLRQASVTDSLGSPSTPTPPTSPEVKALDSPGDSSNSSVLFKPDSRDERGQSKPWEPEMNSAYRNWDGQLAQNFNSRSLAFSKSTSDLLAQVYAEDEMQEDEEQDQTITADDVSKHSSRPESPVPPPSPKIPPPSPKLWGGRKSHEAEEVVDMRRRPHFSLMIRPENDYPSRQAQPFRKQSLGLPPQHLIKGSPPPNVILQSLSGPKREVNLTSAALPLRASYDSAILSQVRRSSAADLNTHRGGDLSKTINCIRPEEYVSVTSRPIMITSPVATTGEESSSNSTVHFSPASSLSLSPSSSSSSIVAPKSSLSPVSSASARRAKLAKYMGAQAENSSAKDQVTEGVTQRPEKPPNYHQALQRNFMLKHSVPINITDDDTGRQRELNAKAKALYEKSLQIYNEQRVNRTKEGESRLTDINVGSSSHGVDSVINRGDKFNSSSVPSAAKAVDSKVMLQNSNTATGDLSESPPSPSESGFLDLGSISHSLQADVLSRREKYQARASSLTTPATSSLPTTSSPESNVSVSLSRHNSRLSDVSGSSSGGSTITISTLGRPSDTSSSSRASMASSVGGDAGSDSPSSKQHNPTDKDFRRMSYSRHFRSQDDGDEGRNGRHKEEVQQEGGKDLEWSSEGEGVYVTLKKNPQQLYLESMKMYEQKFTPATASPPTSSSPPSVSFSSSSYQTPPSEPRTVKSQIAHFHSQQQQQQQRMPSSFTVSSTVQAHAKDHPRTKSVYEASGLHRSHSDASNKNNVVRIARQNPQVKPSSPSHTPPVEAGMNETQQQSTPSVPSSSAHSGLPDISSEHHQNFLKARSCFYNPEEDNSKHSFKTVGGARKFTHSSHILSSSSSTSNLSTMKYENKFTPFQTTEDLSVESGHSPRSKSHVPLKSKHLAKTSTSTLSLSSSVSQSSHLPSAAAPKNSNQGKRELPWSVKSLKSIYDKDSNKDNEKECHPPQPPPYQDPPPFHRHQGAARASTSSSSSAGSEVNADPNIRKSSFASGLVHRSGGPQVFGDGFGSFSSSEDDCTSSLERKSTKSPLDSSQEAISDHTNITYV